MERFSLYDFLGLLLPGVIFLFFCNVLNNLFEICSFPLIPINLEANVLILLCFALIIGAILYTSNFYLVNKSKWYNRIFGMYKPVADLYLRMENLHSLMNPKLNKKATEWYEKSIFFTPEGFNNLSATEQKEAKNLQDEFYDRIYYELEYHGKNEHSKAFHSFYFFFRQTALACLLLLLTEILLFLIYIPLWIKINTPVHFSPNILMFTVIVFALLIVSVALARWYRKRMVKKIYWAYFTHLQLTSN